MTTQTQKLIYEFKRASIDDNIITGFASRYGNRDRHGHIVDRGAFRGTLDRLKATNTALPLLWDHTTDKPIGVVQALDDVPEGLAITAELFPELPETKTAKDLIAGGAGYLSIGFRTEDARTSEDGQIHLTELDLVEISVVPTPSNPLATINRKSATRWAQGEGLSARQARRFVQAGLSALDTADKLASDEISDAVLELRHFQTKYF